MERQRILREIEEHRDEIVALTAALVRIPTVNPPGEAYAECARLLGDRLGAGGFEVRYLDAADRPEHSPRHPRTNVVARLPGAGRGPVVHFNGHLDVVPAGDGWSVDPFGGVVRDGAVWGRGSSDMKGGIAAAVCAVEALQRLGLVPPGGVEVSGTADEESGGLAGVAWLAEHGHLSKQSVDYVIIPEPLGVDRVCLGHRGVYWFEVVTRGRTAHGSMPFLGRSAIDHMAAILAVFRDVLGPRLASRRTALPVIPEGARRPSLNVNALHGGQAADGAQTPCVADTCRAVFDRRFLEEEGLDLVRAEVRELLEDVARGFPGSSHELRERLVVEPVGTPADSPLVSAIDRGVRDVLGRPAERVASPGTYDHKHVQRIAGIEHCVAYGPGQLELAHQPDERCSIDDLVAATQVLALALHDVGHG